MDKEQFKKYVKERQKLDNQFVNSKPEIEKLEISYNEYLETKKKKNSRTNEWYNNKIANDPEFKEYKQRKNKETYNKLKNGYYMSKPEKIEKSTETTTNKQNDIIDKSIEKPIEKLKPINILNSNNKLFKKLNLY